MKKLLVALAGVPLLMLAVAPHASAATTVTKSDPKGDQQAFYSPTTSRMKSSGDIRAVTVTSATRLKVTFKVRDLVLSSAESAKYTVNFQVDSGGTIPPGGRMVVTVTKARTTASYGGWRKAQCAPGVRASSSFAGDTATVSIPVSCLPRGAAFVSAGSEIRSGSGRVMDRGPDFRGIRIG